MIGRSILSYLPVNMANLLTAFGTIVVLTRLLEPEQFGIYAVAMITMQFFHMGLFYVDGSCHGPVPSSSRA